MMDEYKLHKHIICIDLKSFFASVECSLLGLDPFKTPLVVTDKARGSGAIVLAVSPYLKTMGVPGRCRIRELPKNVDIIYREPRMQTYLSFSAQIIGIYLRYISDDDIYVYSIDEAFMDFTNYLEYYHKNDLEIAKELMDTIYKETGIYSSCGIGPNMLMAKLALDIGSKNKKDFVAKWDYEDIPEQLWPVSPLSKMWGIGRNMEARLNRMGFYKIGDIAGSDVDKLKKRFGILGEELFYHTHGIDMSLIQDKTKIKPFSKSYGTGQVLFRDYYKPDIYQIMLEMADDVCRRLRTSNKQARTVYFGIGYGKDNGGGFSGSKTMERPTANASLIYDEFVRIFDKHYEEDLPIRRVQIAVANLVNSEDLQLSLFEDPEKLVKEQKVAKAIDGIKNRFGKNSVNRASSELDGSTVKDRNKMIGGHHA